MPNAHKENRIVNILHDQPKKKKQMQTLFT